MVSFNPEFNPELNSDFSFHIPDNNDSISRSSEVSSSNIGDVSIKPAESDLSISAGQLPSQVSSHGMTVVKNSITSSIYHSVVAGFSSCCTVLSSVGQKLWNIKSQTSGASLSNQPSLDHLLEKTEKDFKEALIKSGVTLNILETFQESAHLSVEMSENFDDVGNISVHEEIAKVGSDLGVLIGLAALYKKMDEVKELREGWKNLQPGDEAGKQDLRRRSLDLVGSTSLLLGNMSKDGMTAVEHAHGVVMSVTADAGVAAASMGLGFASGAIGIVYHAYKTVVYSMRCQQVNREISELTKKIEGMPVGDPDHPKLMEKLHELKEARVNYSLLIGMNGLGTVASCLILATACLLAIGTVGAISSTGIGAAVIGGVVLGVGIYLLCRNNATIRKGMDQASQTINTGMTSGFKAFQKILQTTTSITLIPQNYLSRGYSYVSQIDFPKMNFS